MTSERRVSERKEKSTDVSCMQVWKASILIGIRVGHGHR